MSGGTPVGGGGYIRQRHSQGYASSGDDLEDDACSRAQPFSPPNQRVRPWLEIVENVIWIASAIFIIYFGDRRSNLIYLLWHDERIRRRFDEKWELSSISTLPLVTLLGLVSFCLFSFSLWPIWSFLTLPLLFTLFMACMIIFPNIMIGTFRTQNDAFRID
ncbi:PREDICTED: uncharacterized protein LOC105112239 isoform X2 [Populus euphratica]|uniref:Uncharacterized protein LOC105112239 isoform X2 n=1 Tax=Populus euphratica TaxID=75702 RepID=A0AAJ6X5I3_POPEU|nr:PREDICTED: uncharacterized protein LOC105112239 isoform X2 [Populus euphratica]